MVSRLTVFDFGNQPEPVAYLRDAGLTCSLACLLGRERHPLRRGGLPPWSGGSPAPTSLASTATRAGSSPPASLCGTAGRFCPCPPTSTPGPSTLLTFHGLGDPVTAGAGGAGSRPSPCTGAAAGLLVDGQAVFWWTTPPGAETGPGRGRPGRPGPGPGQRERGLRAGGQRGAEGPGLVRRS